MRLFISYARVDRPYCVQIAETLDIHEVWYDQRLYVGQEWWTTIMQRLEWCDGFVYLLSPESVSSDYCLQEFDIARKRGKHIFPVLIHEMTELPEALKGLQYADFTNGLTPDAVRTLLNAIHLVERENPDGSSPVDDMETALGPILDHNEDDLDIDLEPPVRTPDDVIAAVSKAAEAMQNGNYDTAVYLLKQAQTNGHRARFINIRLLLQEAEEALERQTYEREADREYRPIAELVRWEATRHVGLQAFVEFQKSYPDYDPEKIASHLNRGHEPVITKQYTLPMLEWIEIPAGLVRLQADSTPVKKNGNGHGASSPTEHFVDRYFISKYPVTNRQYDAFLEALDGYNLTRWWDFSEAASQWRAANPEPKPPRFKGADRPRETVTWFEAMAFCNWLSSKTQARITLPTDLQWRRAARGDDDRLYPWGDYFDVNNANTSESKIRMTTLVTRYEHALSPFGVADMTGNVWEWCLTPGPKDSKGQAGDSFRAICGGSFISDHKRARTTFHFNLSPEYLYASIGFRIVSLD
ncbi:MAG: SUMF1/EgtB/PvdO family nonheme iron enzyme [Chloroflexota bacterium]